MGPQGLLGLLALVAITSQVRATMRLFAVAPNMFNINEEETVSVLVSGFPRKTRVKLTVRTPVTNQVHFATVSSLVEPDIQKILRVKVDGSKLGEPDDYGRRYVKLRAQCTDINFDKETNILVSQRTGTVFLQTDKPIYSPGQTVIIRVFALNEQRLGTGMPIRVELKNPQGVITSRKQGATQKGYFMLKHKLSDRPLEGNWTVVAYFGEDFSQSRETKIEVKTYVLPHFQVQVKDFPDYIDNKIRSQDLTATVVARYSFDAPVVGIARIVLRVVRNKEATYLAEKKTVLINGEGKFSLSRQELEEQGSIPTLVAEGARLQIEAIVTEQSTGIRERVVAPGCPFTNSPYRISFKGTAVSFMPGLDFRVEIRVQHVNGQPADKKTLTVTGVDNRGRVVEEKDEENKDPNLQITTDAEGRHRHYFAIGQSVSSITIKVKVEGYNEESRLVVPKMTMTEYMLVGPKDYGVLKPGEPAYFSAALTERRNTKLQYMLVSGGRILEVADEDNKQSNHLTLRRHVDYSMAPSVRLVAWYFPDSSHLVSASTAIPVERACKTEAEVSRKDGTHDPLKPLDQCKLTFKGPIGAKVALMAVDKSVYFLNNQSRLTRKTFFDEFTSRDLGCAAGGGMNATDVFHLAGLTILSKNTFMTPPRQQEECESEPEVSSRGKRSASNEGEGPGDSVCCETGEGFATNLTRIPPNLHAMRKSCYQGSNQPSLNYRKCKNKFIQCCVKRLIVRYESSQEHGRSDGDIGENDVDDFIEDEKDVTPREDFQESWMIISNIQIPSSGEFTNTYTLPGTVTTWVIQAVTMSDTEGMCVAPPFEQVAKKDVFVKLHLPHSAVQGEQIELAATVYKLTRDPMRVKVGLLGTKEACSDAPVGSLSTQRYTVQGFNSWTARWPYVPMETGEIPITVKLFSSYTPDIVKKTLRVVPSGDLVVAPILEITQDPMGRLSTTRQWAGSAGSLSYTAVKDMSRKEQVNTINLKVPQDALSDTAIIKLSLLGDVMTPIVEGLAHGVEKHLHRAGGCGEQTMASVGPTVFAADYLRRTNLLTPELEVDAINKIKQGVGHMLQYRKTDGSYSVWKGRASNVWLTAFALRTFVQAKTFTDQVDQGMIQSGFDWLMSKNTPTGLFDNVGLVHHKNMAGGTSGRLSTTAYVYIAMMEANVYQPHQRDLDRAMDHLAASALNHNDHYTLAIISYALAMRNHSQAARVNQRLLSKAKMLPGTEPHQKYWPRGQPKALGSELEVETAGYGLLAQLALGHVSESNSIVEWLIRQRYGGPKFKSTQSTVVSLQALSRYSLRAHRDNLHMQCKASSLDLTTLDRTFEINDANRLVQQTVEVTKQLGENIILRCTGNGVLHAAIEMSYYSTKSNDDLCAFNITAVATPKNVAGTEYFGITVCTRLRDGSNKLSMPMVDVGIGSGFLPVNDTLHLILKNIPEVDFFEVNDRSVVFYLSEIPSTKDLCLDFNVKRDVDVKNVRPVPVKVYAYYEPDKLHCRKFYNPLGGDNSMLQVSCDNDARFCKCLENACPPCYGYDPSSVMPLHKTELALKQAACGPDSSFDYVFKATLERVVHFGGEIKLTMRIITVAKEGTEHRGELENELRIFTGPAKCQHCQYEPRKNYIIMGEDGKLVKDGVREYSISSKSYVLRLYNKAEIRASTMTKEMRDINRSTKTFLREMTEKGCST